MKNHNKLATFALFLLLIVFVAAETEEHKDGEAFVIPEVVELGDMDHKED